MIGKPTESEKMNHMIETKGVESDLPTIRKKHSLKALDQFITFAAVIMLFIFFSIAAPNFFTARSVLSLLLQTSAVTIMGIGVKIGRAHV